jgi:hypothetical protein
MDKAAQRNCAFVAGAVTFVFVLTLGAAFVGIDGFKALMMASIVGLAAIAIGIGAAGMAAALVGMLVYGGISSVQEARGKPAAQTPVSPEQPRSGNRDGN